MICIIEITFPWVNQINKCIYVFNIALISFNSVFTLCFLFPQFVGGELGGKNPFIKWGCSITLFLMWTIYIILASLKAYEILDWEVWKAEQWQVICYRECQNWAGGPWPWPALKSSLTLSILVLIITQLWNFSASILGTKEKKLYETRFCTATTIRILGHFQCYCVGFKLMELRPLRNNVYCTKLLLNIMAFFFILCIFTFILTPVSITLEFLYDIVTSPHSAIFYT